VSNRSIPGYKAWLSMINRCYCDSTPSAKNYKARGITVCPRWRNSFKAFIEDIGPKPHPSLTLERIDNDGNYEPGNVRWATYKEQSRNKRSNRKITVNGKTLLLVEWAESAGISLTTLMRRIEHGWPLEKAVTLPTGKRFIRPRFY
jgi:hypothetical protein